jgi:hypothetical protein
MKAFNKILFLLLLTVGVVSVFSSCKKDENTGTPSISYVRVTRPESSDSLLVGAGQGQLIAIVGNNLKDAVEIWFNQYQHSGKGAYADPGSRQQPIENYFQKRV